MAIARAVVTVAAVVAVVVTVVATTESPPPPPTPMTTRPVLLLPGFASSQLHAWKPHRCGHAIQKNLYRDVNVGDRLWIDTARILAQGECWLDCMRLHAHNQSDVDCKLRAGDGPAAIGELDPGLLTGPLSTIWRRLLQELVAHLGLGPHELLVAPYDWRLPPARLQARDKFFLALKRKIEDAVALHDGGGGIVVIAHSMGNNIFRYFLAWLRHEVGRNHWQAWIDRHVTAYFAIGAPLLGSSEALELVTSGLTQGLPLAQGDVRRLVGTFGSIVGFLPIPSTPPTSHDADVLVSVRHEGRERNYTSVDIASGAFFREMAEHDPIFRDLDVVRQRFYVEDDVLEAFTPWGRPPIASVYAVYGVNLATKYNYQYQHADRAAPGHWYQIKLENEAGHRQVCHKTGDATVPYHSLSWAHTWLAPNGALVDITRAPQSVYFTRGDIRRLKAIRQGDRHHADYLHASKQRQCAAASATTSATSAPTSFFETLFRPAATPHITFFETTTTTTTGPRRQHTGVWEIDGAGHREILGNAAFLRELRAELRHIFDGHAPAADRTSRPPATDGDCYWNYRQAKCEFAEFCEYRYVFGDVTLDQSCRLRRGPGQDVPTTFVAAAAVAAEIQKLDVPLEVAGPWPMTTTYPRGLPGHCAIPCVYCPT